MKILRLLVVLSLLTVGVGFAETSSVADARRDSLVLMDDGSTLLGWLPADTGVVGGAVTVTALGESEQLPVAHGLFRWRYSLEKPTEVELAIGENWVHRISVDPRGVIGPVAMILVDRPACRPGKTVKYSAFLRQKDNGAYRIIPGEHVKVEIRSAGKNTLIHSRQLHSDAVGRIEGEYTFGPGDALDDYLITVQGYAGSATVKLADFRKSKVKVDIHSEVDGNKLKLTVAALDFLGKPVPVVSGQVTVDVDRQPLADPGDLDPEEFAHASLPGSTSPRLTLSPDEQLLLAAGERVVPGYAGEALYSMSPALDFADDGHATLTLDLRPEWRDFGKVSITALLVDSNGREQRGTKQIVLTPATATTLETDSVRGEVGHLTRVRLGKLESGASAVLLVERLIAPQAADSVYNPYGYYPRRYGPHVYLSSAYVPNYWDYAPNVPGGKAIDRILVTAVPFVGTQATFIPDCAGAYRLTAVISDSQGKTTRARAALLVRAAENDAGVWISELSEAVPGTPLAATIEASGDIGEILVILRDGEGFRHAQTVQLGTEKRTVVSVRIPADCTYGAVLSVHAHTAQGATLAAHEQLRLAQDTHRVKVEIETAEKVDAGEEVSMSIRVGAKEESELVVSVFDQSLLGIAPDKAPDPVSFLFADTRASEAAARDEFRRRLNAITLEDIQQVANRDRTGDTRPATGLAVHGNVGNHLYLSVLQAALAHFGIDGIILSPASQNGYVTIRQEDNCLPLGDAFLTAGVQNAGRLFYTMVDGTVLVDAALPQSAHHGFGQLYWGRGGFARGDARYSYNMMASGNAMVSAQSFVSHIPMGGVSAMELGGGDGAGVLRRDFSDSAFFSAKVRTDSKGRAKIKFKLPDSLTNWQVVATAVTPSMRVGRSKSTFKSYRPVMVWPMLPLSFTEGDSVRVFAVVNNRTDSPETMTVRLEVRNGAAEDTVQTLTVPANSSEKVYWEFKPGQRGFTELLMSAECKAGADASLKRLPVVPCQVESVIPVSGLAKGSHILKVPKDVDLANARLELTIAPSLLADMTDTLPYLMNYPHGCVEQTMSRFLPVLKVCQVLDKLDMDIPDVEEKMPGYVTAGIKRLLSLQKEDGGWGWQGTGGTHEMMTPYALYGLLEAEKAGYRSGNDAALNRGLDRLQQFIDNMGDAQAADRVYCMYVYSMKRELQDKHWEWIGRMATDGKLSDYATALALEMAVSKDRGGNLMAVLAHQLRAQASGSFGRTHWKTASFSRWGDDRNEITAAALKALVAFDIDDPLIPKVLSYFSSTKKGNRWNSTKDTAMVLYALCDYYAEVGRPGEGGGTVKVVVNGARPHKVKTDGVESRRVDLPVEALEPGKNTISFEGAPEGVLFRLSLRCIRAGRALQPIDHGLKVTRDLYLLNPYTGQNIKPLKDGDTVPAGSYISARTQVRHDDGRMRYTLVRCPKPSGCQIVPLSDRRFTHWISQHAQLREDKSDRVLWHHEEIGGSLWDQAVFFCELEGEFVIPPASAELMYEPDTLGSSAAMTLRIKSEESP